MNASYAAYAAKIDTLVDMLGEVIDEGHRALVFSQFFLDPWWNPAAENQSIDWAHRIGQERSINVYQLVATGTIEEKVVAPQESKRDLFDSVITSSSDAAAPLTADDIRGLLGV